MDSLIALGFIVVAAIVVSAADMRSGKPGTSKLLSSGAALVVFALLAGRLWHVAFIDTLLLRTGPEAKVRIAIATGYVMVLAGLLNLVVRIRRKSSGPGE